MKVFGRIAVFLALAAFLTIFPTMVQGKNQMIIMGWIEEIRVMPDGPLMEAKLDTGARTSSLHATQIETFKKNGKTMVRFMLDTDCLLSGQQLQKDYENPLERNVYIRQHRGDPKHRPVVKLDISIGGKEYHTQFTLTDRSNFDYPVLLGRRLMQDKVLVDSGNKHLISGVCTEDPC